jgi:serine/threonine protein kinase
LFNNFVIKYLLQLFNNNEIGEQIMPLNPTYEQLITCLRSANENFLKVPKGCGMKYKDQDGTVKEVFLPQSIIFDPMRKQFFAIKPHTDEEKIGRASSLKSKRTLLSWLASIEVKDPIPNEPLPDEAYQYTKKAMVVPEKLTHKKDPVEKLLKRQQAIAELTTLGFKAISGEDAEFTSDCFIRATSSQNHPSMRKIETITDFIPGDDLIDFLDKRQLDPSGMVYVASRMLWAVMLLQNRGIVHGDLKPEHFIVGEDGSFKVIDFEFAGMQCAPSERGTAEYAAPEVFTTAQIKFSADNFSMGVIIAKLVGLGKQFEERGDKIMHLRRQLGSMLDNFQQEGKDPRQDEEYKEVMKLYKNVVKNIPQLNEEAIQSYWAKIFTNVPNIDENLRKQMLQVFLSIIKELTQPDASQRMSVWDAHSYLSELSEELDRAQNQTPAKKATTVEDQSTAQPQGGDKKTVLEGVRRTKSDSALLRSLPGTLYGFRRKRVSRSASSPSTREELLVPSAVTTGCS